MYKKPSAPSLKEQFIAELEDIILSDKLEIGAKLPPERELAESMHVSRAVVKSGIAEMEKKGFLTVRPRVGTFVADYRKYGTTDTLVSIMHYNGGLLRDNEVRSTLEMRTIFMNLAAALAIERAGDNEIAALKTYIVTLQQCDNPEEAAELIFKFCHELSIISGNSLLPLFFVSFRDLICSLWIRYMKLYGVGELAESASTIYQFVAARDADGVTSYITATSQESISGNRQIYLSK